MNIKSAPTSYAYGSNTAGNQRTKRELIEKSLAHLDALEPWLAEFKQEELDHLEKSLAGSGGCSDLNENWVGTKNPEVMKHFPPRLIVGAAGAEREIHVWEDDPRVKVELIEVDCDYAYSAPTGLFNVQVPHLALKVGQGYGVGST